MDRPAAQLTGRQKAMAQRRDLILAAAVHLFHKKGYVGATTDEIADLAGVTKRTLYRHMISKNHILLEIHRQFIEDGLHTWRGVLEDDGSHSIRLTRLISAHVGIVAKHRDAITVFYEEAKHLTADDRAAIIAQRAEYELLLRGVISEGVTTGEFRDLDVGLVSRSILGTLNDMYRWFVPDSPYTEQSVALAITRMVLTGISSGTGLAVVPR